MAVIVDELREYPHVRLPFKHWCHMASDTGFEELHEFAQRLGIPRHRFQRDHYDLPPHLRERALALGAIEVGTAELTARMAGERGDRVRRRRARRAARAPTWPETAAELKREQQRLADMAPEPWRPAAAEPLVIAGCFVCFPRGETGRGRAGDPAWVAAVAMEGRVVTAQAVVTGAAGAPYEPGLLALREGPLLEAAVRALDPRPDVLLVDATARDHPRRAGLALQLGAVLDLPTVGVTHRPLVARGEGGDGPLTLDGEPVGLWLETRRRARPLAIHPGWRVDPETATRVVLASVGRARTPEPLRAARRLAREARAAAD
jgi:deoxyribonuclease V